MDEVPLSTRLEVMAAELVHADRHNETYEPWMLGQLAQRLYPAARAARGLEDQLTKPASGEAARVAMLLRLPGTAPIGVLWATPPAGPGTVTPALVPAPADHGRIEP